MELLETKVAKQDNQIAELRLLREELHALRESVKERLGPSSHDTPSVPCNYLEKHDDEREP